MTAQSMSLRYEHACGT